MLGAYYTGQAYLGQSGLAVGSLPATLVVANSYHAHTGADVALVQKHLLLANDAIHPQVVDGVTLSVEAVLLTDSSHHTHTTDTIAITQSHQLTIEDTLHAFTSDGLSLLEEVLLAVNDSVHAHAVDNVTIIRYSFVLPDNSTLAFGSDNVVLTEHKTLVSDDAIHAHSVDSTTLVQHFSVDVSDSLHAHGVDAVTIAVTARLDPHDSYHDHTADETFVYVYMRDTPESPLIDTERPHIYLQQQDAPRLVKEVFDKPRAGRESSTIYVRQPSSSPHSPVVMLDKPGLVHGAQALPSLVEQHKLYDSDGSADDTLVDDPVETVDDPDVEERPNTGLVEVPDPITVESGTINVTTISNKPKGTKPWRSTPQVSQPSRISTRTPR